MNQEQYTPSPAKVKLPLAMKLLARALDPAAMDGEAETSAVMFVRTCRREQIGLPDFVTALAPVKYIERDGPEPEPPACSIRMAFGKYIDMTLGEIAEHDPSYVVWAAENLTTKPELCHAFAVVASFYGLGVAA